MFASSARNSPPESRRLSPVDSVGDRRPRRSLRCWDVGLIQASAVKVSGKFVGFCIAVRPRESLSVPLSKFDRTRDRCSGRSPACLPLQKPYFRCTGFLGRCVLKSCVLLDSQCLARNRRAVRSIAWSAWKPRSHKSIKSPVLGA